MAHRSRGAGGRRAGHAARAAHRDGIDARADDLEPPGVAGLRPRRTARAAGVSGCHQQRRVASSGSCVACGRRVVMAGDRCGRPGPVRRALSPPASGPRLGAARVCCPSTPDGRGAVRRRQRAISDTAHDEHDVCGPSCACRSTDRAAGAIPGAARRRPAAGRARTRDGACDPARSRVAHPGWSARAGILLPAAEPRRPREALRVSRVPVRPVGCEATARPLPWPAASRSWRRGRRRQATGWRLGPARWPAATLHSFAA